MSVGEFRQDMEASISVAVEYFHREASASREALVVRDPAEPAARQSRESVLKTRISYAARYFDGLVIRVTGFKSDFHSKTRNAPRDIDALIDDSI